MPRPAAAKPPGRKPAAAPQPVPLQSLLGVHGATGMETAGRADERAEEVPVPAYGEPQRAGHDATLHSSSRTRASICGEACTPNGGRISISRPPRRDCSSLNASRMHRLMPFRSVACAACLREIRMPSRGGPSPRRSRKNVYPAMVLRLPCARSRSKSLLRESRRSGPNPNPARVPRSGTPLSELDRKPLAAARTTRAQHRPAAGGPAADEESVATRATRLGRLVGTLHRAARGEKGRY